MTESATDFRNGDTNLHFLHVNKEKGRTCRACHDTHGSNRPKHVTEGVPFGSWEIPINFQETPKGGSCAPGCHAERDYYNDGSPPAVIPPKGPKVDTWNQSVEGQEDEQ